MSLTEINQFLVKEQGIKPRLNSDSMMMEITWDDQWIGYDDEKSFELKRQFADNLCFGGTMYWSIDFNSGSGEGGLEPEITTDGTCGPSNGHKACGNGFGDCCSSVSADLTATSLASFSAISCPWGFTKAVLTCTGRLVRFHRRSLR